MPDNLNTKKIKKVVEELIKNWDESTDSEIKKEWADNNILDSKSLQNGLEILLKSKFINPVSFASTNDIAELSQMAMKGIKLLRTRINSNKSVGILNRPILDRLKNRFKECLPLAGLGVPLKTDSEAALFNMGLDHCIIFYHIDPSIKELGSLDGKTVEELISTSWQLWQQYIKLIVRAVDNKDDANVVMEMKPIDGKGNILGEAHVGSGKIIGTQLTVTMDSKEDWESAKRFIAATCHEIGHILGMGHSDTPGQLMSAVLDINGGILEPQDEDISRARVIWGKDSTPGSSVISASDNFPGKINLEEILGRSSI